MAGTYRLGLDLGTNSLGWAMWTLGEDGPEKILDMGVRIFSDGREPGKGDALGDPLSVQRRTARGMRRRRDRLLQRKRAMVNELIRQKLWPEDDEMRLALSTLDPYELRAKGLKEALSPEELGRVLFHLAQRRGFKSNRKDSSKDDEKGKNKARIRELNKELERTESPTLGAYMNKRKDKGVRFREGTEFYPDRRHYQDEFETLERTQKPHHPSVRWDKFNHVLFFQRPLRPQEKGKCRFYTDLDRAYTCLPSSQRFRILQELANLRMLGAHGESIGLSREEYDALAHHLEHKKTLSFKKMQNLLSFDGRFNLQDGKRDKLNGNATSFDMRRPERFGSLWDTLDEVTQDAVVTGLMDAVEEEDVVELLKPFKLSEEQVQAISDLRLAPGVGRYSAPLHRECVELMRKGMLRYDEALKELGRDHRLADGKGDKDQLPYYGEALPESCIVRKGLVQCEEEARFGKIGNPTVHIALNQLRKVVNSLNRKHGKPAEIVVELSRDLKVGGKKRQEILANQRKNQKENEALEAELKGPVYRLVSPTRQDIAKLRLYKELQKEEAAARCPYCGKVIRGEELFDGGIEVEHILPFSRTLDDSRSNKTVAHRSCNQKKREQTPYEAFGHSPQGYDWEELRERISNLPGNKRWRFGPDAMDRYREEEGGFLQRQITDNAYIARTARRYLTTICPANKVWGGNGRHTALLRRRWDLNSILSIDGRDKNRSDHRHHAVDAAVIALVDRSFMKKIADANKRSVGGDERFHYMVPPFPGEEEGREALFQAVKAILPSFRADHGTQGRFFKETAYGRIQRHFEVPVAELKADMVHLLQPENLARDFASQVKAAGFNKAQKALAAQVSNVTVAKNLWATRKPLSSIESGDLQVPTYDKNHKGVADFALREKLRMYLETHAEEEVKTEKLLEVYGRNHNMRRVRYIPKNQEITPIPSCPWKGYELDGFAYVDVWRLPVPEGKKPKYQGTFVSYWDATRIKQGRARLPRPCDKNGNPYYEAKKIMRLYKQDVIGWEEEDGMKYWRVAGLQRSAGKIDIQPIWKADQEWFDSVSHRSVPGVYPKTEIQNPKSINALWSKFKIKKIHVHYDGGIR